MSQTLPILSNPHSKFTISNLYKSLMQASQSRREQLRESYEPNVDQFLEDITNDRIKKIIVQHKGIRQMVDKHSNIEEVRRYKQQIKGQEMFLKQSQERKWLTKKGKKYLIDFDDQERRVMKHYFNSLDQKKNGSIGIDELEELLLSVGLFQTREEVKALIDSVDEDKSGKIEFGEFLSMIQNDEGQNEEIVSFFKTVIGDKLKKAEKQKFNEKHKSSKEVKIVHNRIDNFSKAGVSQILERFPYPKGLPFQMVVSHIRRKHMMTALNIGRPNRVKQQHSSVKFLGLSTGQNTQEQVAKGQSVMRSLQKMYERRLVRQIKESRRSKKPMPKKSNFMRDSQCMRETLGMSNGGSHLFGDSR